MALARTAPLLLAALVLCAGCRGTQRYEHTVIEKEDRVVISEKTTRGSSETTGYTVLPRTYGYWPYAYRWVDPRYPAVVPGPRTLYDNRYRGYRYGYRRRY
jgi:hypothetical protein